VGILNRMPIGWASHFCLGPVGKAYDALNSYTIMRLRRWLRKKYKVCRSGETHYPHSYLYQTLGLICLATRKRHLPWAKA
jgi:RNA-directed DNA polymerase